MRLEDVSAAEVGAARVSRRGRLRVRSRALGELGSLEHNARHRGVLSALLFPEDCKQCLLFGALGPVAICGEVLVAAGLVSLPLDRREERDSAYGRAVEY